jgi:PAS domain S-box-containing protein
MNDGMIVLDTSNRIVDINPAALKMIGRTESETIGKTLPRVIPNLPDLLDKYLDIPETQDEITIGSGAAQRWFDLRIASLHDKRRRVIGRVITVHDITARKQTEIRLHESEARYRQIVENAGDIIYRTDASGYFTYVNQPALHIMGFTRESQVLGKHLTDLAAPASRHALKRFYDRQYMLREANTYYEFAAVRADGQEVWIGQNVQIIEEDGQVVGFQAVARDITEIRRARDTMAYARDQAIEANRLKSQLLARVSHELRIPLSGIMGFAELLRDNAYGQLTDEQRRVMEQILDSTNYLTKLIEDLLHQAQMEAKAIQLHREPVALKELFRNVQKNMSVLARTKKLSLSGVYSDDLPDTITGDSQHLQQIMFNLLGNAIKFTKNGGVQIRASRPDAEHWTFEVSDTGIGIPEEAHERIFEPFQQVEGLTEEENLGTGLGLAIAHQLVELMGGTIKVSSKLNVGSTFTVTLPIEQG